jgi:hypothetical protein
VGAGQGEKSAVGFFSGVAKRDGASPITTSANYAARGVGLPLINVT